MVNDGGVLKQTSPVKFTVVNPAVLTINATFDTVPPGGGPNILSVANSYLSSYEWYTGSVGGSPNASGVSTRTITTLSSPTTYWLKYFDGTCSTQVSKMIYVDALRGGWIKDDRSVCNGATSAQPLTSDTLAYGGTQGSYSYQWEVSSTSSTGGFADIDGATLPTYTPQFAPISTNLYFRRKVTNAGVIAYSNVRTITVVAKPIITVASSAVSNSLLSSTAPVIPNGATITLTAGASGEGVQGGVTYQWSPSSGLSSITGTTVQAAPTSTITYTITGTTVSAPGCANSTTFAVTVDELTAGTVLIGGANNTGNTSTSIQVCSNASPDAQEIRATVQPTGGTGSYLLQWQSSTNQVDWQNITTSQNATAQSTTYSFNSAFDAITAPRYYRRAVTNTGVTKFSASVQVTVEALPNILITAESDAIPPGGTNVLTASGSSGAYTWYIGSTSSAPQSNTSATFNIALNAQMGQTTYIVKGASLSGCENTFSKTILVVPITAGVIGTNKNICEGSTSVALLSSSTQASGGSGGNYDYQWRSKVGSGLWTSEVGATQETYQPTFPSGFTATTQFVRVVTNKGVKDSSNVVTYSFVSKPVITVSATGQPGTTIGIPRGAGIQLNATAPAGQPIQVWSW